MKGLFVAGLIGSVFTPTHNFESPRSVNENPNEEYSTVQDTTPKSYPTITYAEDLKVNPSTSISYIVPMPEEEGIRKLRQFARDSDVEEAWVYNPRDELWIEVGLNTFMSTREHKLGDVLVNSISLDSVLIDGLIFFDKNDPSSPRNNLVMYHFHPKGPKGHVFTEAIPSFDDLSALAEYNRSSPKTGIRGKIVSEFGVTEYCISEGGKERLSSNPDKFYGDLELMATLNIAFNSIYMGHDKIINGDFEFTNKHIEDSCAMYDFLFDFTFTPHEDRVQSP